MKAEQWDWNGTWNIYTVLLITIFFICFVNLARTVFALFPLQAIWQVQFYKGWKVCNFTNTYFSNLFRWLLTVWLYMLCTDLVRWALIQTQLFLNDHQCRLSLSHFCLRVKTSSFWNEIFNLRQWTVSKLSNVYQLMSEVLCKFFTLSKKIWI